MKRYVHTTIKMSLASLVAILIALSLDLENAMTAGILAVLSTQLTKTDSVVLAVKRLLDAVLALIIASILFVLFGYTVWVFALFTVVFIALSFLFQIHAGIVPSLVLSSHLLLAGSFSLHVLFNSFLLIGIAIAVALALNVFYPLKSQEILKRTTDTIDRLVSDDIVYLAEYLRNPAANEYAYIRHQSLNHTLERIIEDAELVDKDILFDKDHRQIAYLRMRNAQVKRINRMFELVSKTESRHPHADILADFIANISHDIGHADKASAQIEKLRKLRENYRNKPLPKTRREFETRAILFQTIFELETLLEEKITFHRRYGDQQ